MVLSWLDREMFGGTVVNTAIPKILLCSVGLAGANRGEVTFVHDRDPHQPPGERAADRNR
jgi:hypothetical protein